MTFAVMAQQAVQMRYAEESTRDIGGLLVHDVLRWTARYNAEDKKVHLPVGLIEIVRALSRNKLRRHLVVRLVGRNRIVNPLVESVAAFCLDTHRDSVGRVLVQ